MKAKSKKRISLSFAVLAFVVLTMPVFAQNKQESGNPEPSVISTAAPPVDTDEILFYAFLKEDPDPSYGPMLESFSNRNKLIELFTPKDNVERKFRPMRQWRRFSDRHQRFLPSFLFLSFVALITWSLFPGFLQSTAEEYKKSFWKSFGSGVLIAITVMTLLRAIFISQIGWPLGILIAGLSQAIMLLGLSVAIYNLGHSINLLLQINKIPLLSKNPSWSRYSEIVAGALLSAAILQLPAIGTLPRPGTRLLALFALLGVGALYREIKRRQAQP